MHLAHRDISFVTVSKAPLAKLEEFRDRLGWTFPWVSAANTDFGRDFGVSYTDRELADGDVFHTYSSFARGLENFVTAYQYIDVTPKGRDEAQTGGMGWLRHRDRYDGSTFVHPWEERPGITAPLRQRGTGSS